MRAIILAAGRGSRMKALTSDKPKCLVELRGRSLLERQLEALRGGGVSEIGIVTGYRRELLANQGLVEFHNPRWAETNMVSSLECAGAWLEAGPCIVSYSDIFYSVDAVRSLIDCPAPLAVTYDPLWLALWTRRFGDPLLDAETFRLDLSGRLLEIGRKPQCVEEVQGQYMGLLRFTPAAWRKLLDLRADLPQAECDRMHMTGTLQRIIEEAEVPVFGVSYWGEWGEVDSAEDLHAYGGSRV